MPKAAEPGDEELREIGRRLCALVNVTPEEPVTADQLRRVQHHAACDEMPWVGYSLVMCADALAAHELAPDLRHLRTVLDEYATWWERGSDLRASLLSALATARPLLEGEADRRGEARAEALSEEDRSQGLVAELWPSPESLWKFPQELADVLRREAYAVPWLQKVLHDLSRLDADHRITTSLSPIKTRIAKVLAVGGCSIAQIATVTEPFAKPGRERTKARNTAKHRLESASEDLAYPRMDRAGPLSEASAAELEEAAKFVAGTGTNVRAVSVPPRKSED